MPRKRPILRGRLKCLECERAGKRDPWYDAENFYVNRRRPDGSVASYDSYCIPCRVAYSEETARLRYRHDPAWREKHLERRHRYTKRLTKERRGDAERRRDEAERHVRRLMALGWRQADIALAVGAGKSSVYRWANGKNPPTNDAVKRLRQLAGGVRGE